MCRVSLEHLQRGRYQACKLILFSSHPHSRIPTNVPALLPVSFCNLWRKCWLGSSEMGWLWSGMTVKGLFKCNHKAVLKTHTVFFWVWGGRHSPKRLCACKEMDAFLWHPPLQARERFTLSTKNQRGVHDLNNRQARWNRLTLALDMNWRMHMSCEYAGKRTDLQGLCVF